MLESGDRLSYEAQFNHKTGEFTRYKPNKLSLGTTNKTAFFYGKQAGLSFQDIVTKLNNNRLLDYYRQDPENNKWFFQLEGRSFSTGLQSETAQTWEKIAAFGIGVPLATPAVVQGGVSFAQTFALSNVIGATTAKSFAVGTGLNLSLQISSGLYGVSVGKSVSLVMGEDQTEVDEALFTAFMNIDVADAVVGGLNPFNKYKVANFLVKTVLPSVLDIRMGYSGFAVKHSFGGGKSLRNTTIDLIGFSANNAISNGSKSFSRYANIDHPADVVFLAE